MIAKITRPFLLQILVLVGVVWLANRAFAADPPDFPPIVHILATDPEASEAGADTATFVVFRIGPTNVALTVQYATGGTAANGVDYAALSGTLTIPAGAWYAPITVTPVDDSFFEGAESVIVGLVQPLVWPPPYLVSWPGVGAALIEDNDSPPTNHPPFVRLVNPPDGSVFLAPVDLKLVANATDLDGRVVTVEFFDGTNSLGVVTNRPPIIRPIPLPDDSPEMIGELDPALFPDLDVVADVNVIPPTVFRLAWEDVPPGAHTLTALATDNRGATARSEPVHIKVMDAPPQAIVNIRATDPEATEPAPTGSRLDTATFLIFRNGATDDPLTVFYRIGGTASNGVDYAELPHSATIPRGARGVEVIVEPLDDLLVEGDESVVLSLVPPVCIDIFPPPPDCYRVGREDTARAVIHDNDRPNQPPVVRIVRPEDGSVFLAPADIGIVAQARDPDGRVVTVEFFEGTNSLGIVTNNPGLLAANAPQFAIKWPAVPAGHYVLHAVATDNDGDSGRSQPVEIKVVERSLPPIVNITATDAEAAEASSPGALNTASFAVSRSGDTARPLLVHYRIGGSASNGIDYQLLSGRVIIPAGSTSTNIVVVPIDDRLVEGIETVSITLESALCSIDSSVVPSCYLVGTNDSARAVILDNDVASTNQPPKVAIIRPEDGSVFVAPADLVLYAEAKDADGYVRSVEFFEGTNSLGIVSNSLSTAAIANVGGNVEQIFRLAWNNVPAGGYILTAKATDNRGAMSKSESIRIKVIEDHALPVVTIVAADPWASEGDPVLDPVPVAAAGDVINPISPIRLPPRTATFVVTRDRGTNSELTVHYSLTGSAQNGIDYRKLDGSVTLARGAWRASIVVDPIDDDLVEGTETVIASLDPVACPRILPTPLDCYLVGEPARAIAYIRDNDFANRPPRIAIVRPMQDDRFRVHSEIPIVVQTLDPDGYVPRVEFFADGRSIGVQEIFFFVQPPPGQMQRFSMIWTNVPAGRHLLTAQATDDRGARTLSGPVRIEVVDIDPIPLVNIAAPDALAREGTPPNTATFVIRRSGSTNNPLTVFYSVHGTASNGVDYLPLPGSVTIPAGRRGARIIVTPIDDRRPEGRETVVLRLEDSHSYDLGRHRRAGAVIIDNDDAPPETVQLPDGLFHFRGIGTKGFCYRLEATQDLVNWESLFETMLAEDALPFVDPETGEQPARFFRVVPMLEEEFFDEE